MSNNKNSIAKKFVFILCFLFIQQLAYGLDRTHDTNIPGGDYHDFPIRNDRYLKQDLLCSEACHDDDRCIAWTYVKANQHCWLKDRISVPVDDNCCISGKPSSFEQSINRGGGDYRNFVLNDPRPKLCMNACKADIRCLSWTYVKPGHQGPKAKCWLKDSVPDKSTCTNCDSGVIRGIEYNFDRPGSDLWRTLTLKKPYPRLCQEECRKRAGCLAWTYVKPGVQGAEPKCWLKNSIPEGSRQECCTSGVFDRIQPVITPGVSVSNCKGTKDERGECDTNSDSAFGAVPP